MKFNLKAFFLDLAEIAPSLIIGVINLKNEVGSTSKIQLATDSLTLATGVAEALTSNDPMVQGDAQVASAVVSNVIQAVASVTTPPTPAVVTQAVVTQAFITSAQS
jgi:hypothetical protein